uniref:Uncharacterized protein n=1 Tax=Chelonoidis abingdonii TaxID=106734 RepID=A0A8C0GH04_CHEAB
MPDTPKRLHSPSHPDLLLHRASELRHVQALCDVLVRVGQQDFLAHSLVLACASHTLLCNLDFLAPATFKHALDFAYTGSLEVAPEELTSLLATARDLEMEELEQACLRALGTGGPDGTGIGDRAGSHESVMLPQPCPRPPTSSCCPSRPTCSPCSPSPAPTPNPSSRCPSLLTHSPCSPSPPNPASAPHSRPAAPALPTLPFPHPIGPLLSQPPQIQLVPLTPDRQPLLFQPPPSSQCPSLQTCRPDPGATPAGQRLLERDFCARGFQAEAGLRGPQRASPGEKPYECGECSKRFTLKHQMETHYRVHTGEKPFQCKLCPQRSRDYSAMIKHLRTHGGAAPYRCTLCCQFCPSLAAMQKHMKGHCPEELPSDWTIETTYLYSSSTSS